LQQIRLLANERSIMTAPKETFVSLIYEELMRTYPITRKGKKVRVTTGELICDHVSVAAAKGNKRALKLMIRIQREWKFHPAIGPVIIQLSWEAQGVL